MTDAAATAGAALALGRCDDVRAEVFLRSVPFPPEPAAVVSGTITGPQRGRDTTLPAVARLLPTATAGLARAIVTEPAYWSPDLPNLYRLRATIDRGGAAPEPIDRLVGLRRLGVRGRSFWLDGHRWVPRAAPAEGVAGIDTCKPAAVAAVAVEPGADLLARADAVGVAVLAVASAAGDGGPRSIADRIACWASHPSAVIAILPATLPAAALAEVADLARGRTDTLLLAATAAGASPPPRTIPTGIDALIVTLDPGGLPHDDWGGGGAVPLVAWREEAATPAAGRGPCDALQASLAGWAAARRGANAWDWAGYVVAPPPGAPPVA